MYCLCCNTFAICSSGSSCIHRALLIILIPYPDPTFRIFVPKSRNRISIGGSRDAFICLLTLDLKRLCLKILFLKNTIPFELTFLCLLDLQKKFLQIHQEKSPQKRQFFCHMTAVTVRPFLFAVPCPLFDIDISLPSSSPCQLVPPLYPIYPFPI